MAFLACSCGAMSHKTKDCMDRPRSKGAKWTGKHIAADEKVQDINMSSFDAKRDLWNGYNPDSYTRVVDMCVAQSCFMRLCFFHAWLEPEENSPHGIVKGTPGQLAHQIRRQVDVHKDFRKASADLFMAILQQPVIRVSMCP